jgi:maltodextrin utilization protein YvdJ
MFLKNQSNMYLCLEKRTDAEWFRINNPSLQACSLLHARGDHSYLLEFIFKVSSHLLLMQKKKRMKRNASFKLFMSLYLNRAKIFGNSVGS